MKVIAKLAVLALALCALVLSGGPARAGDCKGACPAAVKVQQVTVAQPVVTVAQPVVQAVVAAPVFVVPSTPTVAIVQQQVVQSVVAVPVVQHHAAVVQQVVQQKAPVTRSKVIQRSVTR